MRQIVSGRPERAWRWSTRTTWSVVALCLAVGLWGCDETDGAGDEEGDSDGGAEVAEDGAGGDLSEADGVGNDFVGDPGGDVAGDVDDAATGDAATDLTDADVTAEVDIAVDVAGDIEDAAVDAKDDAEDALADSVFEEMWADFGVDASSDWDAYPLPDFCPEPWWSWDEWTTPCLAEDPDSCTSEDLHFNRHNLCMARSSSDVVIGTVSVEEYECGSGSGTCERYRVAVEESLRGLSGLVEVTRTIGVCREEGDRGVMFLVAYGDEGRYVFEHGPDGFFAIEDDNVSGVPADQYMSTASARLAEMDPALCRCMAVPHDDGHGSCR
jgi:hypothetical protein